MKSDARFDLLSILRTEGWRVISSGQVGELWTNTPESPQNTIKEAGRTRTLPLEVGIPFSLTPESIEWPGVIRRISAALSTSETSLLEKISHDRFDITEFRVEGGGWRHSVPVEAGYNLFKSARQILRACAATAETPRPVIKGNYPTLAKQILNESRFGQTKPGSYIVPLLIPIKDSPQSTIAEHPIASTPAGEVLRALKPEPDARRVTRTMAESLTAVSENVINRAQVPADDDLEYLIHIGVSRELVVAIVDAIKGPSVDNLEAQFSWSPIFQAGGGTREYGHVQPLEFPGESVELLELTASRLRDSRTTKIEHFSGPIIELRHPSGGKSAYLKMDTIREARRIELVVPIDNDETLEKAHQWFKDGQTLLAKGIVERISNRLILNRDASIRVAAT